MTCDCQQPANPALTAKQLQVFEYIRGYLREKKIAPRYVDICGHTGRQLATINSHIKALRRKGLVGNDGVGPRSLYLTKAGLTFGEQVSAGDLARLEGLREFERSGFRQGRGRNLFDDIRFLIGVVDKVRT